MASTNLLDYSSKDQLQNALGKQATDLTTQGSQLTSAGMADFAPLLAHLRKLVSGDSTELDAAAAPEVLAAHDSYQTARDAVARFSPRGGGQASAMAKNRTSEASDIAKIKASVRGDAQKDLASMTMQLLGLGAQEQAAGTNILSELFKQASDDDQNRTNMWLQVGQIAGRVAAAGLTYGASELALKAAGK